MKRFLKWVETKFSRYSATVEADERHTPVGVAEVPDRVESHEPGKDIQMPNIYDCDDPFKKQQRKTLNESSLDDSESAGSSESTGVDPYDMGCIDTSKSRESRSRK